MRRGLDLSVAIVVSRCFIDYLGDFTAILNEKSMPIAKMGFQDQIKLK